MAEPVTKNAKEWTYKQRLFIEWLALPSELRTPLTQGNFAKEIGVHESTLSDWKKLEGFEDTVKELIMARFGDVLHDVAYSFKREATRGSFQHQKMYFEMMGLYVEKRNLNVTTDFDLEIGGHSDNSPGDIPSIPDTEE